MLIDIKGFANDQMYMVYRWQQLCTILLMSSGGVLIFRIWGLCFWLRCCVIYSILFWVVFTRRFCIFIFTKTLDYKGSHLIMFWKSVKALVRFRLFIPSSHHLHNVWNLFRIREEPDFGARSICQPHPWNADSRWRV